MRSSRSRGQPKVPNVAVSVQQEPARASGWPVSLAAVVLILVTVLVYANSWTVPFVFDDHAAIQLNPSIRQLTDLAAVFSPPGEGFTVDGRPLLNFSLALNYAMSGTAPGSYHVLNLLIHLAAALVLFGIVRRTLLRAVVPGNRALDPSSLNPSEATALGFAVALLWAIHPLQTESVTYVIQRAESLMGLFYLLTLYGFIRATERVDGRISLGWGLLSWVACGLGMGTKEVMVSAPLMVLLYDGIFVSSGWAAALRQRWRYYLALAATVGGLLALVFSTGSRGGTSGFGLEVTPWMYWSTQFQAIVHYLLLTFWPSPLIFDYGVQWTGAVTDVLPYALPVVALVVAIAVTCWRRLPVGFLGVFFLAILAPTSVVPGNRQTLAEHRMYLPLAAVIAFVVVALYVRVKAPRRSSMLGWGGLLLALMALPLGVLTVRRNEVYQSELSLYRDTVNSRPGNASAHTNLGNLLRDAHQTDEAITHYEAALRIRPNYPQAHYNLAIALTDSRLVAQAIEHYEAALRLKPDYPEAHNNLAIALARGGRDVEALPHLLTAVRLNPAYTEARFNLGLVLVRLGRVAEAIQAYDETLRLDPNYYRAHEAKGYALQLTGRESEALAELAVAARLRSAEPKMGQSNN